MDNHEEVAYQVLETKYIIDNAKFKQGSVVYFEYVVKDNNQQRLKTSIGIVTEVCLRKRTVDKENYSYITHDIVYNIVSPKGTFENITECKITSASEFIFREYLKNQSH